MLFLAHDYTYDTRDRLTAATNSTSTNESYTLDDVGNRTASHQRSSYTYQSFNRLTAANFNSDSYDSNGNVTSRVDGSGSWTYAWDSENRLKQASKSGGVTVNYAYDGLSRRIQRTTSAGMTTKFIYNGADVLRDLDGGGSTIADYLNGPAIDNKLRQTVSGAASYFITDHFNTTRVLTDASGSGTTSLYYDSFGSVISGSALTRFTYTGREIDSDVGLMYYRSRWYDPKHGRFLSEDPIGHAGGINLYVYVENNPTNFNDPFGLAKCVYSISRQTLICTSDDGTRRADVGPPGVFSGNGECRNKPECAKDKFRGPVPPGTYDMVPSEKYGGSWWLKEGWVTRQLCKLGIWRCEFFFHKGTINWLCHG